MSGREIVNAETVLALGVIAALLLGKRRHNGAARPASTGNDALAVVSIVVVIVAAYWPALRMPFVSDDYVIANLTRLFSGNYSIVFTRGGGDGFFRPIGFISLAWTWPWAGLDPVRWRAVALVLHCMNSALVYVLARSIGVARPWAWFAGALFAVHGAHPEAVAWIAGRFDVLAAFFSLISLLAFIPLCKTGALMWGIAGGITVTAGILSKESAYAVPLMMAVYAVSEPNFRKRGAKLLAPFFLLASALFACRWALQGGMGGYSGMFAFHPLSFANALLLRLWAILFFPVNWPANVNAALMIATIAGAGAWIALAWRQSGSRAQLLLPLGFTLAAAIPPVGQLLIGADLEKSRVLYLPSAGFCLFAAAAAQMAAPKIRMIAAIAILAFQAVALRHNLTIWENVAEKSKAVCHAAIACSNPESAAGLPRTIDGVYFFANGFPECVRFEQVQHPEIPTHACSLAWDAQSQELRDQK